MKSGFGLEPATDADLLELPEPEGHDRRRLVSFIPPDFLETRFTASPPSAFEGLAGDSTVLAVGPASVLDAFMSAPLVGERGHVEVVDSSQERLARGRHYAPSVESRLSLSQSPFHFQAGKLENLPLREGMFQRVIAAFELTQTDDRELAASEAFRVLAPGGELVLTEVVCERENPMYVRSNAALAGRFVSVSESFSSVFSLLSGVSFRAVRVREAVVWRSLDSRQYVVATFHACRLSEEATRSQKARYVCYRGPFQKAKAEDGMIYVRGRTKRVDSPGMALLDLASYRPSFAISADLPALRLDEERPKARTSSRLQEVWRGDHAIYAGPFLYVEDERGVVYHRGVPVEVPSETRARWSAEISCPFVFLPRPLNGEAPTSELAREEASGTRPQNL